eukprot:scaffold33512_cov113-Skeletonema_dohrnii-CCMP3373.AAC.9
MSRQPKPSFWVVKRTGCLCGGGGSIPFKLSRIGSVQGVIAKSHELHIDAWDLFAISVIL